MGVLPVSRARTTIAAALTVTGGLSVIIGCTLISRPLGLVAAGGALLAAGLSADVGRRP